MMLFAHAIALSSHCAAVSARACNGGSLQIAVFNKGLINDKQG